MRLREDRKIDLRALAELEGLKMSGVIQNLVAKAVSVKRSESPGEFESVRAKVVAEINREKREKEALTAKKGKVRHLKPDTESENLPRETKKRKTN